MKISRVILFFIVPAIVGMLSLCFTSTIFAQEQEAEKAEPTIEEKLAVPENASVEELEQFIKDAQQFMPKSIRTYDQLINYLEKQSAAVNAAVDLILASENLTDQSRINAFTARIGICLRNSRSVESLNSSRQTLQTIIDEFKDDVAMKDVVEAAGEAVLQIRVNSFAMGIDRNRETFEQLDKDIREFFAGKTSSMPARHATVILENAVSIYSDDADKDKIIDKLAADYSALLSKLPEAEKSRFDGLVRRIKLPGNLMEFESVTINVKKLVADADGKEDFDVMKWVEDQPIEKLDIKSLEGKVVLVDCWATWCGPCLMEIPNMLKQYEEYHEKGFEIIGYSCDADLEKLLQFVIKENPPWIIGSTVLSEKQEMKNYLKYYGVSGIPTMILLDRDGKVVSTAARGETLNKLLEELFAE